MADRALQIHVHEDSRVLDGMVRLVELAKIKRPLDDSLRAMCGVIARIVSSEVVSVYLREWQAGREVLVMRGNVGFPASAIGRIQLELDEGLTGVVAQRRRPVSVAIAQEDSRYKHFHGIGEEQFAAYLGVPLLIRDEVVGVLVLQRRTPGAFCEADVAITSSVTGPLVSVIENDEVQRGGRAHSVLVGTPVVPGCATGRAVVLPAPSEQPTSSAAALHALEFDLVTAAQRLGQARPSVRRALDNVALVAIALRDHVATPNGSVLAQLQRVPYRSDSAQTRELGELVEERSREMSELWSFLVVDMQHQLPICGSVLVVPVLGAFVALEAVARGATAVASATTIAPAAREVLECAQIPAIAGAPELLASVRCGDLVEIDGLQGTLSVKERTPDASRPRP